VSALPTRGWPQPAPPPAPPPPAPHEVGAGLTLRHKGLLALLVLLALMALLFALVLAYRASMEQDFDRLERTRHAGLLAAELAQTQAMALGEIGSQLGSDPADVSVEPIERLLARLAIQSQALEQAGLGAAPDIGPLEQARHEWLHNPDRSGLLALRAQLEAAIQALGRQGAARDAMAAQQVAQVHERGRAVSATLATSAALGMALVGTVMVFFFGRLSADIGRLRRRAHAVVAGDRRPDRTIRRQDELGDLGHAIDTMVAALSAGEQALELERRRRFHGEKMASIGALAAGVLHEIGNPIAAIDGLASAMRDERDAGALRFDNAICDPVHILTETARLRDITRRIAELTATPSHDERLLSLNELVRNALLLAQFDPRMKGVRIDAELDPQLPAVLGVEDLLLQLVLDLLVHSAEAARAPTGRASLILVKTSRIGAQLLMTVADNGFGMKADTLARALDPRFDARAEGRAGQLGLPMCVHIARRHDGSLRIESTPGAGTTVTLSLPISGAPS
jgi:signal transduction histidine kinase